MPKLPDGSYFDDRRYLDLNPDVAAAVKDGRWPSGYMHYCVAGRRDGRRHQVDVDPAWYLDRYPRVRPELSRGLGSDPEGHFAHIGAYRGYRPNAVDQTSLLRFGTPSAAFGLWLDAGDGEDGVRARLEIGRLSSAEAAAALRWHRGGWCLIRETSPWAAFETLAPRASGFAQLILEGVPEIASRVALASRVSEVWIQASAVVTFAAPRRFLIAIQAAEEHATVEVAQRGHRLAEPRHLGEFGSLAELVGTRFEGAGPSCLAEYRHRLSAQIKGAELEVATLDIGQGETLFLHADTPFRLRSGEHDVSFALISTSLNQLVASAADQIASWCTA